MQEETVNKIFEILSSNNKNPTTELKYNNEFTLLVAVILSAQATDMSVNAATKPLFILYDTPTKILQLGEEGLKNYIKSIGLFNAKAKNIIALCRTLIEQFGGKVPSTFDDLITLPGVGRKTANVVLNTLFNASTIAVDTHVFRVARRLGMAKTNTPHSVELELSKIIDKKWIKHAHNWLVLHGRYVCKARAPDCINCPINSYCEYYANLHTT